MKSRLNAEVRRARPLLGTIVDIACDGPCEAGFAAIEKVHRLMSFYDPVSDISQINQRALRKPVRVHPWTWRVLKAAQKFARMSKGVFDVTAGQMSDGNWQDIVLSKGRMVRFRRPVIVDLGGIAKGFAVDRAVDALQAKGITNAIVNAGGDIRVFGSTAHHVHLRNPNSPVVSSGVVRVHNRAVATSATYFTRDALVDGQSRLVMADLVSVTVAADDCMTADALTKIVFALREKAAPLLKRCRADALLLERDGLPCWMFHAPCDTRDRTRFD